MRHTHVILPLAAALGIFSATAATPDYLEQPLPERWIFDEHFNQEMPDEDHWWGYFNDSLLDSLIEQGVKANYDLMAAERRINVARQAVNSARAGYYPTINANAGFQKARTSGALGSEMTDATTSDFFSLGLSASWEVDVFGKVRTKVKQQKSVYNATRAEYAGAMTALCANIAKTYVMLRMYQAELKLANEHIATQEKVVKITEARHEAGLASQLDIAQAKTVLYSTQASVPMLENSIHTTINALAVLIGEYPQALYGRLSQDGPLPDHMQIVPLGVPAELLRRRPDIVEAEEQVAASAAAMGIARKEFLPTLTINGSIGTSAHDAGNLFKGRSLTYSIAPTLSWTLFDGMARRASVASAQEQMMAEIDSYNATVMNAVEEVDNCVSTYMATLKKIDYLNSLIDSSSITLDLSLDLYKRGLNPFTDVMQAQMTVLSNNNSLLEAKGSALTALIALYEALGGGWTR